jgi:hypothetical protein
MEPATAALIGAGTASAVSLAAQFLAHCLSIKRDRRNHRRARLAEVITAAATAPYEPIDRPRPDPDLPPPRKGAIADLYPILMDPELMAFSGSFPRRMTLLMIHLGHDHPLIDSYGKAYSTIEPSMREKVRTRDLEEDEGVKAIPKLAEMLIAAQKARDAWSREARAYVEAI